MNITYKFFKYTLLSDVGSARKVVLPTAAPTPTDITFFKPSPEEAGKSWN